MLPLTYKTTLPTDLNVPNSSDMTAQLSLASSQFQSFSRPTCSRLELSHLGSKQAGSSRSSLPSRSKSAKTAWPIQESTVHSGRAGQGTTLGGAVTGAVGED